MFGFFLVDTMPPITAIDPTPYTAWGIVGTLAFTIMALLVTVVVILVRQTSRDRMLMGFVDRQRVETSTTLGNFGQSLQLSQEKLGRTFEQALAHNEATIGTALSRNEEAFRSMTNKLNEVLITGRVMEQVRASQRRGETLDDTIISRIVSAVKSQQG